MKTSWSLDYLNSKYSPQDLAVWRNNKRKKLQSEHHVFFSSYHSHGSLRIVPYLDFKMTGMILDGYDSQYEKELMEEISSWVPDDQWGITFARLHMITGYDLIDIMRVSKFLIKVQGYLIVTDRNGKCIGIKANNLY